MKDRIFFALMAILLVGTIFALMCYSQGQHPTTSTIHGNCVIVTTRNGLSGSAENVQKVCK